MLSIKLLLVVSLYLATFVIGLLVFNTAALAQNSSADSSQSEITVIDRKIAPANLTTVKANVTVVPLTNNTE
jgi:hypothetical protein